MMGDTTPNAAQSCALGGHPAFLTAYNAGCVD
jgi:hypothetical protein